MGLLLSHNSTVKIWNDLVVISTQFSEPPKGGGKRSEIEGFSRESRKRLIEELHKQKFDKMTFITLTYPEKYPRDWKAYKKNLQAFRVRLERKFGKVRIIWRLEYQKRGAPHYHLILFDPPWVDKAWVSKAWYEVVKSGDERHLAAGTNVLAFSAVEDFRVISAYVAKYAAKETRQVAKVDYGKTGRHWGKWNIKKEDPICFKMDSREVQSIAVELFSSRGSADTWRPSDYRNATILGDSMGCNSFRNRALAIIAEGSIKVNRRGYDAGNPG